MTNFQSLPTVQTILERLFLIFPEGTANRNICTTEISAKSIFVMLYVGAINSNNKWIRPDQVTRMTDRQSTLQSYEQRSNWEKISLKSSTGDIPGRWYAGNTRESIRDDTWRYGLIPLGAVIMRDDLPTTSPAPRYALVSDFAHLFSPELSRENLVQLIEKWQNENLNAGAIARIAILKSGAVSTGAGVTVTFPNKETRTLAPGKSSIISKAVIEEFAPRFLGEPGVIWLSESGAKVVTRDDKLANAIGLNIKPDKNLPDIILVDLAPKHPLLVFIEVVATDGPVNDLRQKALTKIASEAQFNPEHLAFVTAFEDRSKPAFKKAVDSLAWGSYAWFTSEPDGLCELHSTPYKLKV